MLNQIRPLRPRPLALALLAAGLAGPALASSPPPTPVSPETLLMPAVVEEVLASAIERVTVYPSSALVTRTAAVPGPGEYVVEGLPHGLNRSSVRVRAEGMQVMRVDVRQRFVRAVPDARLGALQTELERLRAEERALVVERTAATDQVRFYRELLQKRMDGAKAGADGDVETWREGGEFLSSGLATALDELRAVEEALEDKREEVRELEAEIARGTGGSGHTVQDVYVSLDGPAGRGAALELDYLIGGAWWTSSYDLRADQTLRTVGLTYRADVVQTTGEDWSDVELYLSTANPMVGAAPPELAAIRLSLEQYRARYAGRPASAPAEASLEALGYLGDDADGLFDAMSATVLQNAGSLRYKVARRETIPSRSDGSRVLIGGAELSVEAEHRAVPALDASVWLRGRATNDSQWELLPGTASVYFGGDFVGRTELGHIRTGEEFVLDLGLDPNVTVERIALEDKAGSAGFFGSKETLTKSWRLRFKATGAAARRPDGTVRVVVHEVLPKSQHEDLEVDLEFARPALSDAARYAADRADEGILTWELLVPHMGEATIEWGYELTFPEDMELIQ